MMLLKEFFSGKFNFPISLAFLIAFFNQLSGINAVIYYSPRIFAKGISFKEITVKVVGDIELDLDCTGTSSKNSASVNRGLGLKTTNKCKGKGKIIAEFPQQRSH